MVKEIISKLIAYYRRDFFTEPVLLLTFIICFFIALMHHRRERARLFFLFYFFAGILLFAISSPFDVLRVFPERNVVALGELFNTTFELIEFVAFYWFFKKCLRNHNLQVILKVFFVCLLAVSTLFFLSLRFPGYTEDNIRVHSLLINVLEFFFIAFLCLAYFYELLTSTPKINLFHRPSFFIATSAFFYSVLLIPFFIVAHYMRRNVHPVYFALFSCHYLLLTIMLLTIAKAFLRRQPITT